MNARTPTKPANKPLLPLPKVPQPPRMRPALRMAVELIIELGVSQREASRRAGMNETVLGRALKKPHIAAYVEHQKALFLTDMLKLKDRAKAIAIAQGIDLMHSAQSEAVRARMVELFASEPRPGASVAVQVNVDRGGYEFVRPGARMVEIDPAPDLSSGDDDGQDTDK